MVKLVALAVLIVGCGPASTSVDEPTAPTDPVATEPTERPWEETEAEQVAAIQKGINDLSPAVYVCRSIAAADDLAVDGEVQLSLTVDQSGKVVDSKVLTDTVDDPALTECLLKAWSGYGFPPVFADGDGVQLPAYRFVSEGAQYKVNAKHVKPRVLAGGKLVVSDLLHKRNTGNGHASMAMLIFSDGHELRLHESESAQVVYVFLGGGSFFDERGKAKGTALSVGGAYFVPAGQPSGFVDASDGEQTVLLRVYVPGGPESAYLSGHAERAFVDGSTKKKRRRKIPGSLTATADQTEELSIAQGMGTVRFYFDQKNNRDKSAYMGVLTGKAGLVVPEHTHDTSTELLFVLQGTGTMTVGGKEMAVGPWDSIQIPPGTRHGVEVSGEGDLVAVQFYSPSGPEQRFRGGK